MTEWRPFIADNILPAIKDNLFWKDYLNLFVNNTLPPYSLHLAVFIEPFLQYVLDGSKKIESRFSAVRCAPYKAVKKGDVVLLKKTGGPILGLCMIKEAWFYELEPSSWQEIKENYALALCAQDPAFWEGRKHASFATLMSIQQVQPLPPITIKKRDRRGWVIIQSATEQLSLLNTSL